MNEELSLASHLQLDADNIWETLSESINSLGEKNHVFDTTKSQILF